MACLVSSPVGERIELVRSYTSLGKGVQLVIPISSIRLRDVATRDGLIRNVSVLMEQYGFTGIDIFDWGSACIESTETSANLISALQAMAVQFKNHTLTLSIASRLLFDCGKTSYLPVIDALRDNLSAVFISTKGATPLKDSHGRTQSPGNAAYLVALADLLLGGFSQSTGARFTGLRPEQLGFSGCTSSSNSSAYISPAVVQAALRCISRGSGCGSYSMIAGPYPGAGAFSAWSINEDSLQNSKFATAMSAVLRASLPDAPIAAATSASTTLSTILSQSPTPAASQAGRKPHFQMKLLAAIIVPIFIGMVLKTVGVYYWARRRQRRRHLEEAHVHPFEAVIVQTPGGNGAPGDQKHASPPQETAPSVSAAGQEGAELAALHSEIGRVGLTVPALLSSLSRLGTNGGGAEPTVSVDSEAPPSYD